MLYEQVKGLAAETFRVMVEGLRRAEVGKRKPGRPSKLNLEDQVLLTLMYLRENRTYFHIGHAYGVNASTAYRMVRRVEDTLAGEEAFKLPSKQQLPAGDLELSFVVVDVTETPIERPKRKQRAYYSGQARKVLFCPRRGKKKCHTLKAQVVLDQQSKRIVCTAYGKGQMHDLKLFKNSQTRLHPEAFWLADSGYQGVQKLHANTEVPHKRRKGQCLTPEQKRCNRVLTKLRLSIEHVNAKLKVFCILSERYQCRRRRFGLRFNLIAEFYNFELGLSS